MWLKIDKDRLTGDVRMHKCFGRNYLLVFTTTQGNGDEFCEFVLIEKGKFWHLITVHLLNALSLPSPLSHEDGFIAFGSVKYPGVYVGINTQGEPRVPSITGTQGQALFTPTIKVCVCLHV